MQERNIIENFLAALKAADVEAACGFVAPDAIFVGVRAEPNPSVPPYGTRVGHEGLRTFLEALGRTFARQSLSIEHVGAGEGVAFASGQLDHIVAATGKRFFSEWVLRCRIGEGKITHYQFCEDSAGLEDALSPGEEAA
ncbi:nuclear transport factor 2 family protein [uncultured Nitratireductor sp.]|uniref:nuclear transport factor 2 family protein n=1 Tax=uncultured Nitratireductor sp. TaxID=520953 RepID=UPI0025F7A0DC|nr:nuclear transport factor 2 family protein [uncultured Nitratireductor sp.]